MNYEKKLNEANTIPKIFELVKELTYHHLKKEQAGLLLGLTDLGSSKRNLVGAYYSLNANMIMINKRPLARIMKHRPDLQKHYLFYIILHEYIHSIGSYDENQTRQLAIEILSTHYGEQHQSTKIATNINEFLIQLAQIEPETMPTDTNIEFVHGIDRKNTDYIN